MEPIQVVITMDPQTTNVHVSAPSNKVIAYGMLQMALEVIGKKETEEPSKVIRPVAVVPNGVGR